MVQVGVFVSLHIISIDTLCLSKIPMLFWGLINWGDIPNPDEPAKRAADKSARNKADKPAPEARRPDNSNRPF